MSPFVLLIAAAFAAPSAATLDFSATATPRAPLRLGVISGPTGINGSPDLTTRFHEFGIQYVRNNDYYDDRLDLEAILNCGGTTYPSWEGCDAKDERSYQWEASDALMKTFRDGGFEPMLRLGGEWQNSSREHDFKGPQNSAQEAGWITAAAKVATRYRYQYTYLDIWTEFPGEQFWDRENSAFYPFWAKAYRAVKSAVPEARVGGPGFAVMGTKMLVSGGQRRQVVRQFLEAMYAERVRPDWIGWHIFSNEPTEYAQAGLTYRRLLEGTGEFADVPWARSKFFTGVELVLDAFGTTDRDHRKPLDPSLVSELHNGPRGAAVIGASLVALAETDTTRAYLYRANDPAGGKRKRAEAEGGGGWVGLFSNDAAGTPKKTAHAVRLWTKFTADYPTLVAVADPHGAGAWGALANGTSGSAVYLANPTGNDLTLDSVGAIQLGKLAGATGWFLDVTRDGTIPEPLLPGAIKVPAWSVVLVITGQH